MAKQDATIAKFMSVSNQTSRGPSVPNGEANARPKPQGDAGTQMGGAKAVIDSTLKGPDKGLGAGNG